MGKLYPKSSQKKFSEMSHHVVGACVRRKYFLKVMQLVQKGSKEQSICKTIRNSWHKLCCLNCQILYVLTFNSS